MLEARLSKSRVADVYRRIAPTYDLWGRLTESRARDRCIELAAIRNGEDVLEVAVGTGLAFEKIIRLNPDGRNEGIDLTPAMLSRAEEKAARCARANYRLRVGDAYELDYPDDSFDVVVNNYMFDLLPEGDFPVVLAEFRRVLRPGGRLAMVNMAHGERWYNAVWPRIYRINPALLGGCRSISLLPALVAAGFVNARREYLSQMTFPSEVVYGEKRPPDGGRREAPSDGEYSPIMADPHRIAGIDGCRGGWFVAAADKALDNVDTFVALTIDAAMERLGTDPIVGIDIPIGLPDAGPRDCDLQARRMLSPRRTSSVFPAPLRSILGARNYETACDRREAIDGRRLSVQAFNILGKIDEVDRYLRAGNSRRLYEVHPELAFAALNGGEPMAHPKRSREGLQERRRVLGERVDGATIDEAWSAYPRSQVARDDVLDAFAVLVAAERIAAGVARRVPASAVYDSAGIDMAIWF